MLRKTQNPIGSVQNQQNSTEWNTSNATCSKKKQQCVRGLSTPEQYFIETIDFTYLIFWWTLEEYEAQLLKPSLHL